MTNCTELSCNACVHTANRVDFACFRVAFFDEKWKWNVRHLRVGINALFAANVCTLFAKTLHDNFL